MLSTAAKVGIVKGFNAATMKRGLCGRSSCLTDNWPDLSETERDEWRGYFDRMLERLQLLGYTSERNPCSMLLET